MMEAPANATALDDCWNRKGVRGDRSCPSLAEHIHCRNCPVFAEAARGLLDRPVPADYAAGWSSHFAAAKVAEKPSNRSAVVFRIGSEWFALPTDLCDEISERRRIHSLPHQRNPAVLGLVNIRGALIICVSLARMLSLHEGGPGESGRGPGPARMVVMRHASGPIAFPVAEVQPTLRFHEDTLRNVPVTVARASSNYVAGLLPWRDRQVGYLDVERVMQSVNRSLAS